MSSLAKLVFSAGFTLIPFVAAAQFLYYGTQFKPTHLMVVVFLAAMGWAGLRTFRNEFTSASAAHLRVQLFGLRPERRALARSQRISQRQAAQAAKEFSRWISLVAAMPSVRLAPPRGLVSETFELLLSDPRRYARFCRFVARRPIDLRDIGRGVDAYALSWFLYERWFRRPPPPEFWPRPDKTAARRRMAQLYAVTRRNVAPGFLVSFEITIALDADGFAGLRDAVSVVDSSGGGDGGGDGDGGDGGGDGGGD